MALNPPATARESKIAQNLRLWIAINPDRLVSVWRLLNASDKTTLLTMMKADLAADLDTNLISITAMKDDVNTI